MTQAVIGHTTVFMLPTGQKVLARRPSVYTLIASGGFPAELTQIVYEMTANPVKPEDMMRDPERLRQLSVLIDTYVPHVLVSPKIGPLSQNSPGADGVLTGTIALIDLSDVDKIALFLFGQGLISGPATEGGADADLKPFRDVESSVDAGRGVEEVRAPALVDDGARSA